MNFVVVSIAKATRGNPYFERLLEFAMFEKSVNSFENFYKFAP